MDDIKEQYKAERERIKHFRDIDWSTLQIEYIAAGEPINSLTVQAWFDLLSVKNPIICGGEMTVSAVVDYVWKNSKRNKGGKMIKALRLFLLQRRIEKTIDKAKDFESLVAVLRQHLDHALEESPESIKSGGTKKRNSLPASSGQASLIDEICARYGWTPCRVLKMPLRRVFSLQRALRESTLPDYKLLEPYTLREIKSKYLESLNNGAK